MLVVFNNVYPKVKDAVLCVVPIFRTTIRVEAYLDHFLALVVEFGQKKYQDSGGAWFRKFQLCYTKLCIPAFLWQMPVLVHVAFTTYFFFSHTVKMLMEHEVTHLREHIIKYNLGLWDVLYIRDILMNMSITIQQEQRIYIFALYLSYIFDRHNKDRTYTNSFIKNKETWQKQKIEEWEQQLRQPLNSEFRNLLQSPPASPQNRLFGSPDSSSGSPSSFSQALENLITSTGTDNNWTI